MPPRVPNQFIDPAGVVPTYLWDVNHDEEEGFGKSRAIEHTANTGNTGLVRQQGSQEPMLLKLSGTILKLDQYNKFWLWWTLCDYRTFHYQDFTGFRAEVLITDFQPKKVRAAKNNRGGTDNPLHYWKYTMTMEVITFVANAPFVFP